MTIGSEFPLKIITYPHPSLEAVNTPITEFNEDLAKTLDSMTTVMLENNGIGLAANQVGINKTMFVMKNTQGKIVEVINPVIISVDGNVMMKEGCLSFPKVYLDVYRPAVVELRYVNRSGEKIHATAEELDARCILHEYEHLTGKTFLNSVTRQQRRYIQRQLEKQ